MHFFKWKRFYFFAENNDLFSNAFFFSILSYNYRHGTVRFPIWKNIVLLMMTINICTLTWNRDESCDKMCGINNNCEQLISKWQFWQISKMSNGHSTKFWMCRWFYHRHFKKKQHLLHRLTYIKFVILFLIFHDFFLWILFVYLSTLDVDVWAHVPIIRCNWIFMIFLLLKLKNQREKKEGREKEMKKVHA